MTRISLPEPDRKGNVPLEETIEERRSVREYHEDAPGLDEIGQIAWAAQGITDPARNFRAAPSAGATFPVEIYLLTSNMEDLENGLYHYDPVEHKLLKRSAGDLRQELSAAALRQEAITNAPVVMVVSGVLRRTEQRYGDRALRYLHMEAGHVSQNVYLQAVALDIGTVAIGAFSDEEVRDVLDLDPGEHPLYIMPLGRMP